MKIIVLPSAQSDLAAGFAFYDNQEDGLGVYFMESLGLARTIEWYEGSDRLRKVG